MRVYERARARDGAFSGKSGARCGPPICHFSFCVSFFFSPFLLPSAASPPSLPGLVSFPSSLPSRAPMHEMGARPRLVRAGGSINGGPVPRRRYSVPPFLSCVIATPPPPPRPLTQPARAPRLPLRRFRNGLWVPAADDDDAPIASSRFQSRRLARIVGELGAEAQRAALICLCARSCVLRR